MSIKALRSRKNSVQSLRKVTEAMATSARVSMQKWQDMLSGLKGYLHSVTSALASCPQLDEYSNDEQSDDLVIALFPEQNMCGSFAHRSLREVRSLEVAPGADFWCTGQKRGAMWTQSHQNCNLDLIQHWVDHIVSHPNTRSRVVYGHFVNSMSQDIVVDTLFPLDEITPSSDAPYAEFTKQAFDRTIRLYLVLRLYCAYVDNALSSSSSLMTSMDNATQNAGDMIKDISRNINRVRQTIITQELMEVISGAESLL